VKIFITVIITLAAALGGVWGYSRYTHGPDPAEAAPTQVRIEPAARMDVVETVTAPGTIEPRTKVSISAKVAARIVDLPHKEGETVYKGSATTKPSVLVRLDDKDLQAALRSAKARYAAQQAEIAVAKARLLAEEASILAAKVTLADAKRDLMRQQGLLATHDVSQSVVDAAQAKYDGQDAQVKSLENTLAADQTNLDVLRHNLDAADAEIAKAEEDVANTVIESPIDGTVIKVNSEVGEMVVIGITNTPGTTIMEVADLNEILFKARVDDTSIALLKRGQRAHVHVPAYPDRVFEGVVTNVALANTDDKDTLTKYFKSDVLLKTDGERIPSGLTADAEIETKRHDDVIAVPSQAVLGRPADELPEAVRSSPDVDKAKTIASVVYRMIDGKAVVTPVTVGASNATHTIITSGLKEGEKVIVGPFKTLDSLKDGQKVVDMKATTKPTTKPAIPKSE
jgi:HlyD family secretion protein